MHTRREYKETPLDGGENPPKRVNVIYYSDDCAANSRAHQFHLLNTVVENPGLLDCGSSIFQTLKMHHNGNCWVITLEATVA